VSCIIPFPAAEPVADESSFFPYLVPLHAAVAKSRRRHRSLVAAAGQWALARGLSLPADHVALWAAAAEQGSPHGDFDGVTGPWSQPELHCFLWSTLGRWCALAGCRVPGDLPESLCHLYGFLADTGRLHPGPTAA
jgi:hypothetical protein